jgi:hypothetical protein
MIYTLPKNEPPKPGDLFFATGDSLVSMAIRLTQLDGLSHSGVVLQAENGWVKVAESLNDGFIENDRKLENINGYFIRVGTGRERNEIVKAAKRLLDKNIKYSWSTIVWHFGRMLTNTKLKWLGFTWAAGAALKKASSRFAANPDRMICSESTAEIVRYACTAAGQNTPLKAICDDFDGVPGWQISPIDLFRSLLGRRS